MTHIGTPIAMPQGSYYLGLFFTTVFVVSCPLPSSVISLPFINLNLIVVETPSRSVSDCSPDIWQPFLFSLFLYSSYISYEYAMMHALWQRHQVLSSTVCHSYCRGNSVGSKTFYVEPRFVVLFVANLLLFDLILGWSFLIHFLLWA